MDSCTIDKILARYERDMEVTEGMEAFDVALMKVEKAVTEWMDGMSDAEKLRVFGELENWCRCEEMRVMFG